MNRPRSRAIGLGSAAILLVAMAVPGAAQSPASDAPASPAVTHATAVGPIEWKRVTKGKDFTSNPEIYSVAQLPDGRLVVVGNITGGAGRTGAMWSSADGRKWTRAKIKAPEGSIIFAVAHAEQHHRRDRSQRRWHGPALDLDRRFRLAAGRWAERSDLQPPRP